jgi:hypothetical protein
VAAVEELSLISLAALSRCSPLETTLDGRQSTHSARTRKHYFFEHDKCSSRKAELRDPKRSTVAAVTIEMADLLRAIEEDIDNLAHWHPLADWLIERDDPRGELINIDLALEANTGDAEQLNARRKEILAESAPKLLGDTFSRVIAEGYGSVSWRRGFVDNVKYSGDPSLGHLRSVGWLIRLMVANREPFALMRRLDLSHTDIADLAPLATFPHLVQLDLAGCKPTKQSFDALRAQLPNLKIRGKRA